VGPGLRELRVALLARQRRRPVRMLLAPVTDQATHPQSALALAFALARSELTTVLIDATAGASGITGVLGLDDAAGFSDALTQGLDLQEALHPVAPHLQVMPAGHRDARAQDLLVSPSMVALLDHLEQGADVVIVAAGPIGGAPARALAMAVDNIVVEAVGGRTRTSELTALADGDGGDDWQVTGVVYVDPRRRGR
jgi:Mrp family chromosome partitioning ATPase